jgi:thioredoxin 1
MAETIITLSDDTFDEQLAEVGVPLLVDFWAEWCGPCKVIAPMLEEIADSEQGALRIAKVNVDDNPRTAQRFQVMSVPTLILFKDGEPASRIVGAQPKTRILSALEPHLS